MAQGEYTLDLNQKEVSRFDRSPLPAGEWQLKLLTKKGKVQCAQGQGKIPYFSFPQEALGSAGEDGKNNKWVYNMLFCNAAPSEKDGKTAMERQGGLLDLARALGTQLPQMSTANGWIRMQRNEKGVVIPTIDAKTLGQWLAQFDGRVVGAVTRIKKADKASIDKGFGDQAVVDYYVEAQSEEETAAADDGQGNLFEEAAPTEAEPEAEGSSLWDEPAEELPASSSIIDVEEGETEEEAKAKAAAKPPAKPAPAKPPPPPAKPPAKPAPAPAKPALKAITGTKKK